MPSDHYFSAEPRSARSRRTISARLAGREVEVETSGGVFSPGHVDQGTTVLLKVVPPAPTSGALLDLGCGWGPIALSLALQSPDATVWAVDVNTRALELVRANTARLGLTNVRAVTPEQVPDDVEFATIWSNPPIRVGKAELHGMLRHWMPRLAPDATAWLVVQKNLGADSLQRWITDEFTEHDVARAALSKGFRVLTVQAPA